MWIVTVLLLFVGGVLGALNLIISKNPNAKEMIDKMRPFAGIIGIVLLIWGVIDLFHVLRAISVINLIPLWWTIALLTSVVEIGLGFLLGFPLINQYALSGNAEAAAKGEQMRAKLTLYQIPMGMTAIVLSIVFLVMSLR